MKITLLRIIAFWFSFLFVGASNAQQPDDIERIAGFARLYGVVRYFHPSDAAQEIDWNRFVQYGVREVQQTQTTSEYESALLKLFKPITCGLTIGNKTLASTSPNSGVENKKLVRWQHLGPGVYNIPGSDAYSSQRTNRKIINKIAPGGFVTMMQSIDAKTLRGKTVRLSGFARTENATEKSNAAFWLRVDRADSKSMGFFDNMSDRPIRKSGWSQYTIEGPVAEDAVKIAFGAMVIGTDIQAGFDDMHLEVRNENRKWESVSIEDGGFETGKGWLKSGSMPEMATYDLQESSPPEGKHWMKIAIPKEFVKEPVDLGEPKYIEPLAIALAGGLTASVPLALEDDAAKIIPEQSVALADLKKEIEQLQVNHDSATSLADVIAMWAALRHFYPYWDVVNVNWDEQLTQFLQWAMSENGTNESHLKVLRKILAEIKDGHAGAYDRGVRPALIPIKIRSIEGKLIVVATNTDALAVGDVILTINGQPAEDWFGEKRELISGSEAWRDYMTVASFLESGPKGANVWFTVQQKDATHKNIKLSYSETSGPFEKRPASITQIKPDIWYIDLTKAMAAEITTKITELSQAKGVIFDLRGYPTDAGAEILPYLINTVEHDRWMHVPHFLRPGGKAEGWSSAGWDIEPKIPIITSNRVFLTNGEAISYAESVMGYIKDRKLAFIIGSTTAGANGNVVRVDLPSGALFLFTGMRVTHHDGASRFHGLGIEPDKMVKPTLKGIRAGRDELLESAIEHIYKSKMAN
jgi:Peptidase family S41